MITVKLDADAVAKTYGKKAETILQRAVDVLGEYALDRIRQKSSERLSIQTWQEFSKSVQTTRDSNSITLTIDNAKMESLETGYGGFDIKPGMLRSSKVKQGKSGPYIDVPFSHRITKRGKGSYIEPTSMRKAVNKALQKVKSSGGTIRLGTIPKTAAKLAGMRITSDKGAQTFRRISANSPNDSWQHPGYEGLKVFEETARDVESIKDRVIEDIAKGGV